MYKTYSGDKAYAIEVNSKSWTVDGEEVQPTFERKSQDEVLVHFKNESVIARLHKVDVENKVVIMFINNKRHEWKIEEPVDLMLEKLGMSAMRHKKVKNLKAPMPGLILKLLVEEGQEVTEGTPLLILEAMKMENVYKATADAQVRKILVKTSEAVEKNQELIQFA